MFDIGFSELLLIAVLAMVFIGPEQLPGALRQIMKIWREIRAIGDGVKRQMQEVMDETGLNAHTVITDLEGKKQPAYDVAELEKLAAPKKPEAPHE